jgi:tetratricopeptide (TPR) repeat protein
MVCVFAAAAAVALPEGAALPIPVQKGPSVQVEQLLRKGRFAEARSVAQTLVSGNSESVPGHSALVVIYGLAPGTRAECEKEIATLKKLKPGSPYLPAGQALLAQMDKNYDKAIALMTEAVRKEDNPLFHSLLGQFAAAKRDMPAAEKHLRKALSLEPDMLPAGLYLARILMAQRKPAETFRLLARYGASYPNSPQVHALTGSLYAQTGQAVRAEASYRRALALDPKFQGARRALCDMYAQRAAYGRLKTVAEQGLKLDPPFTLGHHYLGLVLARRDKMKEATASFQKAIEAGNKLPQIRFFMGATLLAQNDTKAAAAAFAKVLAASKDYRPAAYAAVAAGLRLGNAGAAVKALETAIQKDKRPDAGAHMLLACAALAAGDKQKAGALFQKAAGVPRTFAVVNAKFLDGMQPRDGAGTAAAVFYDTLGWPDRTLAEADAVLAASPKAILASYFKGRALWATGKRSESVGAHEAAVREDSTFLPSHFELGRLYAVQRKPGLVRRQQRTILQLKPDAAQVRRSLLEAYMNEKEYTEAAAVARRGLAVADSPFLLGDYYLGTISARQGDFDKALEHFKKYADATKNLPDGPYLLGVASLARARKGDVAAARAALKTARERNKNHRPSLMAQAILHHATGSDPAPIQEFKETVAKGGTPMENFVLANMLLASGKKAEAKDAYTKAAGFTRGFKIIDTAFVEMPSCSSWHTRGRTRLSRRPPRC